MCVCVCVCVCVYVCEGDGCEGGHTGRYGHLLDSPKREGGGDCVCVCVLACACARVCEREGV